ncbi:MAG: rhomboid family intramembrane serine protease, partial [Bacteroidota bacterium]
MITIELTAIVLILANVGFSYKGFQEEAFRNRYNFHVDPILIGKEYIRMLSSGFLHTGWWHLLFNMYTLYVFSQSLEFGGMSFVFYLILYFVSLFGGNGLALFIHRNHGNYRAVGASGAVSGVVFATISLFPFGEIFFIKAWLFGIIYTLVTIYGVKSRWGNIGHEAHLGGTIVGILMAILFDPSILTRYTWIIFAMLIPIVVFLFLIIKRPEFLLIPNFF